MLQGGLFAGKGAQRAFMISLRSLAPTVFSFLKWSPELILSSAAFPALQAWSHLFIGRTHLFLTDM